jgi:hypothetical protein
MGEKYILKRSTETLLLIDTIRDVGLELNAEKIKYLKLSYSA